MKDEKKNNNNKLISSSAGNKSVIPIEMAMMNKIAEKAKTLVPLLIKASKEPDKGKRLEIIAEAFRRVDVKMNAIEIYEKAKSEDVVKRELVECEMTIPKEQYDAMIKAGYAEDYMKRSFCRKLVLTTEKSRKISHLVNHLGIDEVSLIIRLLLVNFNASFNVKNPLNNDQIYECAELIIEKYGSKLYIDELIYIFKRAKMEIRTYDHLSGNMIYTLIDAHFSKIDEQRHEAHIENKSIDYSLPDLPNTMLGEASEQMTKRYKDNFISIAEMGLDNKKSKDKN